MNINNDAVIVILDRPRELRFGHKSLKLLESYQVAVGKDDSTQLVNFEELEYAYFLGLQKDARAAGETLPQEQVADLLDEAESEVYLIQKFTEALARAYGIKADLMGNGQAGTETAAPTIGTNPNA